MKYILVCLGSFSFVAGEIFFSETFGPGWQDRWVKSKFKGRESGKWVESAGRWFRDKAEDTGIQTGEDEKFFGISASFPSFTNAGRELIVQYQVKYENEVGCGGGYFKLGPRMDDPEMFGDPTVYNIMFGPDMCGFTKRTHLVFNYKGKNVLKRNDMDYLQDTEGTSHLYRLIVRPDNTVRVEIDGKKIYEGSIHQSWEFAPEEIDDPNDHRPADWADEKIIDDPLDVKPDDWVDAARIVDPESKKPDDWDDDEDGPWEAAMIDNPEYMGEWEVQRVYNPAYKGFWEVKKIANPEYAAIPKDVYKYDDFSFIGFDVWQVKGGAIFDNIIITDDKAEADTFAKKWRELRFVEVKKFHEDKKKKAR